MKFNNRIIQGNFAETLDDARLDKFFDLILTSPPYYTARNYGGIKLFSDDPKEWETWCLASIIFLSSKIKDTGVIWWNTASGYKDFRKLTAVFRLIIDLEGVGIYLIDDIPWVKTSTQPKHFSNRPYAAWEHNFIFSKYPNKAIFYKDAVRRPYNPGTLERMKYRVNRLWGDLEGDFGNPKFKKVEPHPGGASHPNYISLSQDYSRRPHPAPMTPKLAEWAIKAYSPEDGFICDPMAGIGTTWVECEKLGRHFLGCELYEEYISIAKLSIERLHRGEDPYNGLKKEWESINESKNNRN